MIFLQIPRTNEFLIFTQKKKRRRVRLDQKICDKKETLIKIIIFILGQLPETPYLTVKLLLMKCILFL